MDEAKVKTTVAWLTQLAANARTVNDSEGEPLAICADAAKDLLTSLVVRLRAVHEEHAQPKVLGRPLTPEEQAVVEQFTTKMEEEVIPAVVRTMHERHQRAADMANLVLRGPITSESSTQDLWDAYRTEQEMHAAWRKRAEHSERAELAAEARLRAVEAQQAALIAKWREAEACGAEMADRLLEHGQGQGAAYQRGQSEARACCANDLEVLLPAAGVVPSPPVNPSDGSQS